MLDIKPLPGFEWDCFVGHLTTIASWRNCKYEMAFADAWTFCPLKQSNTINENYELLTKSYRSSYDQLVKKIDFKLDCHTNSEVIEVFNIFEKELSKRPILIKLNLFWCPWFLWAYKKVSQWDGHAFLIIGIDHDNKIFRCTDVSLMEYNCSLPFEDFKSGYNGTFETILDIDTPDLPDKKECLSIINNSVSMMLGTTDSVNKFESIRVFALTLEQLYKLSRKEKPDTVEGTKLHIDMTFTLQGRLHFANALKLAATEYNMVELMEIYGKMLKLVEKWISARALLIKLSMKNDNVRLIERLSRKIYDLSLIEEQIAFKLLELTS